MSDPWVEEQEALWRVPGYAEAYSASQQGENGFQPTAELARIVRGLDANEFSPATRWDQLERATTADRRSEYENAVLSDMDRRDPWGSEEAYAQGQEDKRWNNLSSIERFLEKPSEIKSADDLASYLQDDNFHEFGMLSPDIQQKALANPALALWSLEKNKNRANYDYLSIGAEGGAESINDWLWDDKQGFHIREGKYKDVHHDNGIIDKAWNDIFEHIDSWAPVAMQAVASYFGGPWAGAAVSGANTIANDGDMSDILKNAAIAYVAGEAGNAVGEAATGATEAANAASAATEAATNTGLKTAITQATKGVVSTALKGGSAEDILQSGLISGLTSGANSTLGEWGDSSTLAGQALNAATKSMVDSLIKSGVKGEDIDWDKLLVNAASSGLKSTAKRKT